MADIEIDVSGTMSSPTSQDNSVGSGFQLPQSLSIKAWLSQCYQNLRPWSTFFNTSHFNPPPGIPQLTKRLMKNAVYFLSNYVVIVFILTLYCLITTPLLLLAVCASLGICYSLSRRNAQRPLVLMGRTLTMEQQYALVAGCSIPVYVLVGAGSAMFWVLGASLFFTTLHAVFFNVAAIANDQDDQFDGISVLEDI
uniref:PRA1 family protein n=1 Tax=Graphocephala atropunctata TaxID=36148 RepID=A0A1B6MAX8_9HEMI